MNHRVLAECPLNSELFSEVEPRARVDAAAAQLHHQSVLTFHATQKCLKPPREIILQMGRSVRCSGCTEQELTMLNAQNPSATGGHRPQRVKQAHPHSPHFRPGTTIMTVHATPLGRFKFKMHAGTQRSAAGVVLTENEPHHTKPLETRAAGDEEAVAPLQPCTCRRLAAAAEERHFERLP
jgi:hypothetical protein